MYTYFTSIISILQHEESGLVFCRSGKHIGNCLFSSRCLSVCVSCYNFCFKVLASILLSVTVNGDYELEVTFYRFDNPNQRCEECHLSNGSKVTAGCCDDMMTGDQCSSGQCEMYFTFCHERLLNTSSSSRGCPTMEIDRRNYSLSNTDGVSFGQKVFGLPNPLTFSGYQWVGYTVTCSTA